MAWRDSRKNRSRLLFFISSIVLGIAALVAIAAFGDNLKQEINDQAASLIGADLEVSSNKPLTGPAQELIDSLITLSDAHAEEQQFASMVRFTKNGGTRLVQIRTLAGAYPFYGQLETLPTQAANTFLTDQKVLIDKTLLLQFEAEVGDSVQLGNLTFQIAGSLLSEPGKTAISGSVSPSVFMPLALLEQTGLSQKGSRINYKYYFRFATNYKVDELIESLDERLEQLNLRTSTIATTQENTGRSFADLTDFLGLVGFVALMLGCLGVSSAIHVYVKEKLLSVAILRCLGVSSLQAFLIYLVQIIGIGLIGAILGALLGTLVQQTLPIVLQDFLPVRVDNAVSWRAILQGIIIGLCMAVLFALIPLISVRHVSPLRTLRVDDDEVSGAFNDRIKWAIYLLILLFIAGFARFQLNSWYQTLSFIVGIIVAFGLLYGVAILLIKGLRRYTPTSWPYVWRQGFANLYRPNNQTVMLMVAVGLGTALIASLFFTQGLLLNRIMLSTSGTQPNMVLFDVQSAQKDQVTALTRKLKLPIMQEVPVVTMQLTAIKGYTAADLRKDSTIDISSRAFGGEIRSTYRNKLTDSEKITSGRWTGKVLNGDTARISLDKRYAERLGVIVGDHLQFNVQGVSIPTIIGSLRDVDWNRMQTNFRVVFPLGVIDDAPQFHVIMTKVPNDQAAAYFQQEVVKQFPNVSIIDLGLVLSVLDTILDKIGFVIQFIGAFSILTGVVVLVASVMISKYQRIRENVLLRTMGASRKQIFAITACEYLSLGLLASLTGIILALIASFLLATFVFEASFRPNLMVILILLCSVSGLTLAIGLFNSRSTLNQPPLVVLRKD
ncbi:ABC transporter permease [Olivibacter sp. SDN3]|uniref:ABC transporter permease n=1 Tax=Olivibacter sp. SDN3 TaxID=2764720 RepID=UPI001651430A|nr:FtsX-like permease family protein [Olivibacter sp. SDN3]QNL48274.1 ABC transporter permease [Olivibacter sp. SDN3]